MVVLLLTLWGEQLWKHYVLVEVFTLTMMSCVTHYHLQLQ